MWKLLPSSQFESVQAAWNHAGGADANFLRSVDFVGPLIRAFGTSRELVAIYEEGGSPQAAAVLTRAGMSTWSTFQSTETCLGLWVTHRTVDQAAIINVLLHKLPGFPLVLAVTHQDPELSPRPGDVGRVRTLDYIETASVNIEGGFDQYWAARGKNLRTNTRRARSQLQRTGVTSRLDIITRSSNVAEAIAEYGRLEMSGWKGKAGTAVHPSNAQGRFYIDMLQQACEKNVGQIYRYLFNDKVVAMDLCVEDGNRLVILKTAYDEESAAFSPATLMREEQCRALFHAARLRKIEFYGPVKEWHTRWTQDSRTMYHVNYYRHRLIPQLHTATKQLLQRQSLRASAHQSRT